MPYIALARQIYFDILDPLGRLRCRPSRPLSAQSVLCAPCPSWVSIYEILSNEHIRTLDGCVCMSALDGVKNITAESTDKVILGEDSVFILIRRN